MSVFPGGNDFAIGLQGGINDTGLARELFPATDEHDVIRKAAGQPPDLGGDLIISDDSGSRTLAPDEIKRHAVPVLPHERIIFDRSNVRVMNHKIIGPLRGRPFEADTPAGVRPACQ